MIYSASPFKNELDVLEIRLGTIGHLIDRFVIAEATVDQRGRPKPLVFPQHRERFAPWLDRIEYVVVDDMPTGDRHEDDVARERFQRDAVMRGMPGLRPDDVVYLSDLDEIPYPQELESVLDQVADTGTGSRFAMDLHVYALNWRWLDRGCRIGTLGAALPGRKLLDLGPCGAVLWDREVESMPGVRGWHLTYQGDVETLRSKMTGMMDAFYEQLVPDDWKARGVGPEHFLTDEWIQGSIDTGRDIYAREYRPSEWVGLDQLPPYVQENAERFAHMLVPEPAAKPSGPRCTCGAIFSPDRELAHFQRCALSVVPGTLLCREDVFERVG